jgi:hypothetical protein
MDRILAWAICVSICLVELPTRNQAETFVLEPVGDVRILSIFPDSNFENDFISIYTAPGNEQRTLLLFDFNNLPIPTGHQVTSAVLSLIISTGFGRSQGVPMEVYRVVTSWTASGATWKARQSGALWIQAGGDYAGRFGVSDANPYAINSQDPANGDSISWEIAELVQEWLEEFSPNQGLLLRSYFGNGLTFPSVESATSPAAKPKLTISTAPGLPRLRAVLVPPDQIAISWRGENIGVLEESNTPTGSAWTQTPGTPTVAAGRTELRVPIGNSLKFFRLKSQ